MCRTEPHRYRGMIRGLLLMLVSAMPVSAMEIGCGVTVIPPAEIKRGCGCGYHLKTEDGLKTFLQSGVNGEEPRLYFNGELVPVEASSASQMDQSLTQGDEFEQRFTYDGLRLVFRNRVVSECRLGEPGCNAIRFASELQLQASACSVDLDQIIGDCGC